MTISTPSPMPSPQPRLRSRILSFLLIGGSVLSVGAVAFTSYWIARDLVLHNLEDNALLKVKAAGTEIDAWLNRSLGEVQTLAASEAVRSMNWDVAEPFLQLEQDRLSNFWMFILVNPDGSYYTTRSGFATGKSLSDREYFQKAMLGQSMASDLVISRTTGKRQINISVPIWSFPPANYDTLPSDRQAKRESSLAFYHLPSDPTQKPTVIGNLAGNIPLAAVTEVVSKTQSGQGSYAFALDSKGVPIAHPNAAYTEGLNSFLNNANPALVAVAKSMVDRQKGIELVNLDHQWVYVAFAPINRANWSVALVIPRANLESDLNALNALAGVVGGLLVLAIIAALKQLHQFREIRDRARQETHLNRQLQQTSHQLEDTLTYLGAIIDNLADGLLVTDSSGKINCCNPALLTLFGMENSNPMDQSVDTLFGNDLTELIAHSQLGKATIAEISLADGRIGKAVVTAIPNRSQSVSASATPSEIPSIDLSIDPSTITVTPESQSEQRIHPEFGSVILIRDVTSEKEVDQMKTDFISTVSHELRTPLTSVLGFAKLIKKKLEEVMVPTFDPADKKLQRAARQVGDNIDIIVSEGLRLTALINDVLDIAKMEAGKVDWKMDPLPITEVIERAIAATSALFDAKTIPLVRDIDADLPLVVGDRDRLIQVVINLLSNAIKFTDQGNVTCRAKAIGDTVVVSIIDAGIGITPEDQPKVFEKFKQVGDTLTDKPKGTGLGLPICKQIIEHHQGHLWVESTLGVGSTFAFSLPAHALPLSPLHAIDLATLLQQLQPAADSPRKHILVVDDEAPIRQLLRQQLEAEGYFIQEARNGTEAVQQAKQHVPNLIILDVMMPDVNGFDVAAALRNDPQTMGIPILILSIVEDADRDRELGIDRRLPKPINLELLIDNVQSLMEQGRSPRTILVIHDDQTAANALIKALQGKGYTAVEAQNNPELIKKMVSLQPHMLLADPPFWDQSDTVKLLQSTQDLANTTFLKVTDEPARATAPQP